MTVLQMRQYSLASCFINLAMFELLAVASHWCNPNALQGMYHQAILGDLNTMAHGIARFSPKFCTDKMRFWSLGQSEASFWHHKVFCVADPSTVPEQDHAQRSHYPNQQASPHQHAGSTAAVQDSSASHAESASTQEAALQEAGEPALFPPRLLGPSINSQLQSWGLSEQVCKDITNPGMLQTCCAMINAHTSACFRSQQWLEVPVHILAQAKSTLVLTVHTQLRYTYVFGIMTSC